MPNYQRQTAAANVPTSKIVLYVTDLVSDSDETLASACELAEKHGADIEVIHVIDVGQSPSRPDGQMGIQYRLEQFCCRLRSLRERVKSLLLFGSPVDVISKRASDVKVKLIAFGNNGSSSARGQQKLISSVTRRVACPVVTITSKGI
jgi:nucleotide-binding universal stress UspA family protein